VTMCFRPLHFSVHDHFCRVETGLGVRTLDWKDYKKLKVEPAEKSGTATLVYFVSSSRLALN
jgi:hypothetical protein